jgi:hypothetical protein
MQCPGRGQGNLELDLGHRGALVLVLAVYALVVARPRRQVLVPFLPSLAASTAIYSSHVEGASSFHQALVLCIALATGFAFLLVVAQPWQDRLATFSWALLGVDVPPVVLFALIATTCWGQTECLG